MDHQFFPDCRLYDLPVRGDHRGSLIAIEAEQQVPFPIARAYYIFGSEPNVTRGQHAHHRTHQVAICVRGALTMLVDDGREQHRVRLDRPDLALHVGPMIWHEMNEFTDDCVLLVFADDHYREADYIRSYDQFRQLVGSLKATA